MSLNNEKVTFWDFEGVLFYLGILKILIVHYFDQLTRVFVKRIPQPEQALTQSPWNSSILPWYLVLTIS